MIIISYFYQFNVNILYSYNLMELQNKTIIDNLV